MPRTRAPRAEGAKEVKPNLTKLQKEIVGSFLEKAEKDAINKLKAIDVDYLYCKFKSELDQAVAEVPKAALGKTLNELRSESEKAHYETAMFKSFANSTTKSMAKKNTRIDPLTAGRSRRRSKSQMTIKMAKIGRTSRSLSRTKIQHPSTSANSYVTPALRNNLPPTGTITPKMKANTPSVILRRPRQGEMAVSMQGSPLMVSGVSTDQAANVNIPLQDGRIVSIQPNRGIRKSELPELDSETLRQMEVLRDNLIKVCEMR